MAPFPLQQKSVLSLFGSLVLLLVSLNLPAQTQETILKARIWLDGKTMQDLDKAGLEIDHGFYEPGQSFQSEFAASELMRVKVAGFRIDTLESDVVAKYLQENAKRKPQRTGAVDRSAGPCDAYSNSYGTPLNYTYGSLGGYYTYEEFLAILDDMHAKFPKLISARDVVSSTLLTHEGRPQWFVRISDHPDSDETDEPEALYTALHHAREPNSLTHLIYFMWSLLENYDKDPEIRYLLDHTELYFIPCLNPDGYIYNQTTNPAGGGFWRKNRRDNGDGTYGVDLNRNYGYNWGNGYGGSSNIPAADTYHGPEAFSEPETQMAKAFIEAHNFEIALNCHTSGNKLVHPWGYINFIATPDFTTLSNWFTRESNYQSGSCYQTLGYLANGTSDDWMYGEKDRFAFTPETGGGFWPYIDAIDDNNKGMFLTNLSAAWYALGGAVIRRQPGEYLTGNTLNVPFKVKQYELGTAPIQISFEALSANILGFSSVPEINLQNFESASFTVVLTLNNSIPSGEIIRFVARSTRENQIHTDTIEMVYQPNPFNALLTDNNETPTTQWLSNQWAQTPERAYSPSKSMTDSPNSPYTLEENNLSSAAALHIPADATEARLRFFAYWDIEPELDWTQVLISTDGGDFYTPLEGVLTHTSNSLAEPVYDGDHRFWEAECMDLSGLIDQPFYLRFSMNSFSGNASQRDGFYFDDLVLEYNTEAGVFTVNVPDAWILQSRPNPASDQTLILWENQADYSNPLYLEVCSSEGKFLRQIPITDNSARALKVETSGWASGMYLYRLVTDHGNSGWKKLAVVH